MALHRRGWIAVALVAVVLAVIGQREFGTHNTPPGQPPFVTLTAGSIESLRTDFNRAADQVRIILLLSPT